MLFLEYMLDILLPKRCVVCHRTPADVCPTCMAQFSTAVRPLTETIWAVYDFRDRHVRSMLWALKYHNRFSIAKAIASQLHERLITELSEIQTFTHLGSIIVIPIPVAPKRLRERGYNQAEHLARAILMYDTEHHYTLRTDILTRLDHNTHQARIKNRAERLRNPRNTYVVKHAKRIQKATIVLIDDVTTTGATLAEAKRVLKKAGAKRVYALCVAH